MRKKCKYCGAIRGLKERIVKEEIQVLNICNNCFSKKISEGTKKALKNMPEDKKQEMYKNQRIGCWYSKSKREQNTIIIKRLESTKKVEKERREKISKYWKEHPEERKERDKKGGESLKEALKKPELKEQRLSQLKQIWNDPEKIRKGVEKRKEDRKKWSKEKKEKFRKKVIEGNKNFINNLTKEEKEIFYKNKNRKRKETISKWPKEFKDEVIRKIREGTIKRLKKGTIGISKIELSCLNYIEENIDKNIEHQKRFKKWAIDFYSPKYDVYIQLDGEFWHGIGYSNEKLNKMKDIGLAILKAKRKDKEQNEIIPNLIRITDKEFKNNPNILKERISSYLSDITNK